MATWRNPSTVIDIGTRTLQAINDPDNWPQTVLPVIRRTPTGKICGIVAKAENTFVLWRDAIMFLPPSTWKDRAQLTAEEIIKEGWEVD